MSKTVHSELLEVDVQLTLPVWAFHSTFHSKLSESVWMACMYQLSPLDVIKRTACVNHLCQQWSSVTHLTPVQCMCNHLCQQWSCVTYLTPAQCMCNHLCQQWSSVTHLTPAQCMCNHLCQQWSSVTHLTPAQCMCNHLCQQWSSVTYLTPAQCMCNNVCQQLSSVTHLTLFSVILSLIPVWCHCHIPWRLLTLT